MIFGLTHTLEGNEIIRLPKSVKVGIGGPKGKAIHVWMERATPEIAAKYKVSNVWKVEYGTKEGSWKESKIITYTSRAEVDANYERIRGSATTAIYPRKLDYFTFLKPTIDGYVHDLEAIELHGPKPTSIGIIFVDDDPFECKMAMWGASELRCSGNGIEAQRVLSMAATPEELELAREAKENGAKYFSVLSGCATAGCPYSKPTMHNNTEKPPMCKPSGDLAFQLVSNIRLGSKSQYLTTGFRTISQIFSSIAQIRKITGGRVAGIPFKLAVLPYKTNHNGQAATQYAVHLEVYENKEASKKLLAFVEQARDFQRIAAPAIPKAAPLALAAPPEVDGDDDEDGRDSPMFAAAMVAEFQPDNDDEPGPATAAETVAAKTEEKTTELKDSLEGKKPETRTSANALKERLAKEGYQAETKPVEPVAEKPPGERPKKPPPFA